MPDVLIENPILNSPYDEPTKHFRFGKDGITNEVIQARRSSIYFVPVPKAKRQRAAQRELDPTWTGDRIEKNVFVDQIRERVALWRQTNYSGLSSPVSRRLLEHWNNSERDRKLFFCQREALETLIYLNEIAEGKGDAWIRNDLEKANNTSNPGLQRLATKMATGSGKTVVMAMLIAYHVLNKQANPTDARFSDAFLIVTPGITIRDRLRVLFPNDPENYYDALDIVPSDLRENLGNAKIIITNYHALQRREKGNASRLTKAILGGDDKEAFKETEGEMIRRVMREIGNKASLIVINDEAHHCYARRPDGEDVEDDLKGDAKTEAKKRNEEARLWLNGLRAVSQKYKVRAIYDLSATPFFLQGSGWKEGTLFPWVVSDFSLIDAIESGIVKVPRVPVDSNDMVGSMPAYRELWEHIKDKLPKKGRGTEEISSRVIPRELEGAIETLYQDYKKEYGKWEANAEAKARGLTPPVFIVVCNNTNVSKLVCDYISGYDKTLPDGTVVPHVGELPLFNNVKDGQWLARPVTILIDSTQLESGEAMSDEFKRIARHEIDDFKEDYKRRFPGRDAGKLTDEDILREVMNTVGKPGKLGEHIRCVVSVSMLTEGWDANTVTHILGVRAFGTQLLCEQVVGRGLRRMSYAVNDDGMFEPEYAEVYGVPFSFIPCSGTTKNPKPGPIPTRVRALESRIALEVTFPRLIGYRYEVPQERITATFTEDSHRALSTKDIPTEVLVEGIAGASEIHTLDDLRTRRENEVAFFIAKIILEKYFHDEDGNFRPWLFPQLLGICQRWLSEYVTCKDNTFKQLFVFRELANEAADKIYRAIVSANTGEPLLRPILQPHNTYGTTRYVDFFTTKPTYETREDKCHISHVVCDTGSWEQKMAQTLENMEEVKAYAKNQNVGLIIPYTLDGEQRNYYPDFLAHWNDGKEVHLNLIIEVTGIKKKDKQAKVETAAQLWVPAVNNHGGLGRWGFIEVQDPWDAENLIRGQLRSAVAV